MTDFQQCANAIRVLSMDAVQAARSGHPGMPMGMADIATVLWRKHLNHNPTNPHWFNRDRFVLSNGHGSMLLYSLLHLTGYAVSRDALKNFRQLHSPTAGHPEVGEVPGVETTTGPLGQGLANAVGMAIAEQALAAEFNSDAHTVVDHHTFAFCGDGCLMEGISHEVCSLAGTLGLGKLIVCWDDNGISIDGNVEGWFTDDTPARFRAYGWDVIDHVDGHDAEAIDAAIVAAKAEQEKPTLICCKTQIGFGSPNKAGLASAHGAPLGDEEIANTRQALGWTYPPFEIPEAITAEWDARAAGSDKETRWNKTFAAYESDHPAQAAELMRRMQGFLPMAWDALATAAIESQREQEKPEATRKLFKQVLNALAPQLPELMGGSSDLTGSNCTDWSGMSLVSPYNPGGNYIEYGVREFGMSAIMNGLALHGGFIPYGGTFLVFSDYARNAIRMSALMQQRVVYVLSHDSIGLGEDGPTHQPIEHASMLRLTPGLDVWRPADGLETAVALTSAIEKKGPSCLLTSRQSLPALTAARDVADVKRGAYVLCDTKQLDAIIIATGSEVELALAAADLLAQEQVGVRVVSMPCMELFLAQSQDYQAAVLPSHVHTRVAVEAGATGLWYRFVGLDGVVIGVDRFGLSAPYQQCYAALNISSTAVCDAVKKCLSKDKV